MGCFEDSLLRKKVTDFINRPTPLLPTGCRRSRRYNWIRGENKFGFRRKISYICTKDHLQPLKDPSPATGRGLGLFSICEPDRELGCYRSGRLLVGDKLVVELDVGLIDIRDEPQEAYAESEDTEERPADEAEIEHEELPLVATHHHTAFVDAALGVPVGVVESEVGAHGIGICFDDAGDDQEERPQDDIDGREEAEEDRAPVVLEPKEDGGDDVDVSIAVETQGHLLKSVSKRPTEEDSDGYTYEAQRNSSNKKSQFHSFAHTRETTDLGKAATYGGRRLGNYGNSLVNYNGKNHHAPMSIERLASRKTEFVTCFHNYICINVIVVGGF